MPPSAWLREDGEPARVDPTHWAPLSAGGGPPVPKRRTRHVLGGATLLVLGLLGWLLWSHPFVIDRRFPQGGARWLIERVDQGRVALSGIRAEWSERLQRSASSTANPAAEQIDYAVATQGAQKPERARADALAERLAAVRSEAEALKAVNQNAIPAEAAAAEKSALAQERQRVEALGRDLGAARGGLEQLKGQVSKSSAAALAQEERAKAKELAAARQEAEALKGANGDYRPRRDCRSRAEERTRSGTAAG